jgi:hypothetical protein
MPLAGKVKQADYVLDGRLALNHLRLEVRRTFQELARLA